MTVIAVIPARFAAARLPGKPLLDLAGKPLIAHVVERALAAKKIDKVLVATDHEGIASAAQNAGAEAIMTEPNLPSGSDRMGAALRGRDYSLAINLQGDEPEIEAQALDALVDAMARQQQAQMGTLSAPLLAHQAADPNCVKVVTDAQNHALYFSRAPIATRRDDLLAGGDLLTCAARRHVGVYAYRPDALQRFLAAPPSELEKIEQLEQLRALELGMRIVVVPLDAAPRGIDTLEDLQQARQRFAERKL